MRSRIDGFIIWPNGVQCIDEIMNILRGRFKVITIKRKDIDDIESFVDDVYSIDTYPIEHLRAKTRYLLKTPGDAIFVLVRNNHVREKVVGKGRFRARQCQYVQKVKFEIRGRFNPEKDEHVIHGTDYPQQVEHILNLFGMRPISYYTRNEGTIFPYHIDPFEYEEVRVPIQTLKANINGTYIPIKNTPHYAYVTGDKKAYEDYFYPLMGRGLDEDHFPGAFDKLIKVESFDPILIDGYKILDGVHRASIELERGNQTIKAYDRL